MFQCEYNTSWKILVVEDFFISKMSYGLRMHRLSTAFRHRTSSMSMALMEYSMQASASETTIAGVLPGRRHDACSSGQASMPCFEEGKRASMVKYGHTNAPTPFSTTFHADVILSVPIKMYGDIVSYAPLTICGLKRCVTCWRYVTKSKDR